MFRKRGDNLYYGDVKIAKNHETKYIDIIPYDLKPYYVRLYSDPSSLGNMLYVLRVKIGSTAHQYSFKSEFDRPFITDPNYYDKILELSMMLRRQHDAMEFIDESSIPYKEWDSFYCDIYLYEYSRVTPLKLDESDYVRDVNYREAFYIPRDTLKEKISRYMSAFTATKHNNVKRAIN